MERQHVKTFNQDSRSTNRFRFSSTKQRAKKVSADVYRSYKRHYGVTSAGDREETVHRPKRIKHDDPEVKDDGALEDFSSTFAEELEIASEKNGSQLFNEFYREVWPLVRSVPELLHHSSKVVDALLSYMLSPEGSPNEKSPISGAADGTRQAYIVNHATTDILHLLAVMAKDLQHEIHPCVYEKILPRIIMDVLNPPPPPPESGKQAIPVDVLIVETAFRTLSYIFQHDTEGLLSETVKDGEEPCLEQMRKFYGPTLGHKREVIRRLAAETFAPLLRKIKTDDARKKHLKRVVRALTASDSTSKSQSMKRAQADAIDGVSSLLFQAARGVAGRLHSKGSIIIRFLFDYMLGLGNDFSDAMSALASSFLGKVYRHIGSGTDKKFDEVCEELQRMMKRMVQKHVKAVHGQGDTGLICSTCLIQEAVEFRDGVFFDAGSDDDFDPSIEKRLMAFVKMAFDLTEESTFGELSLLASTAVVKLFFTLWNTATGLSEWSTKFENRLSRLLRSCGQDTYEDNQTFRTSVIVRTYLESCDEEDAVRRAFPSIISAIATLAPVDQNQAMGLLFRVVSRVPNETSERYDKDSLFTMDSERSGFSCEKQESMKLLELCLKSPSRIKLNSDVDQLAQLGYSARCIPLLCSILDGDTDCHGEKKAFEWIVENLKMLVESIEACTPNFDFIVPAALLVEGFSTLVIFIHKKSQASWLKPHVEKCRSLIWTLVKKYPSSIWVMKSAGALCEVLSMYDMQLCDDSNAAFDLLVSNLRKESHFLRLHTLQVLNAFPQRPFVVNHSDLDLADDLDEEPSFINSSQGNTSGLSGSCDIMQTLLKIEATPAGVDTDRGICSLITRAEVLGKSGRLPIAYAEALSNHLIGIFYIRFSSLWVPASRALCGLTKDYHSILCNTIGDILEELLEPDRTTENELRLSNVEINPITHHQLCVEWDTSGGRIASLFHEQIEKADEAGHVSPFLCTDRESVFQEVLRVLEFVPEIVAKHSRRIVPLFLDFLNFQYYCFHDNDPDALELKIEESSKKKSSWSKEMMNRKTLQNRLSSFLTAFAAVKGTAQLFQRSLLLSIFSVNLSHQDAIIAEAALKCIINFRLPHVTPYADQLQHLLKKGGLRDALLEFPFSKDSDVIHSDHRPHLLPVVERILFGRLSASSTHGTSSKDSPLVRRKAIVSALAKLEGDELFPLVYLMIRNYAPSSIELLWENVSVSEYRKRMLEAISSSQFIDYGGIPVQRHEGFVNLVNALVSQLGHSLNDYVPTFISILLGIIKSSIMSGSAEDEESTPVQGEDVEHTGKTPRSRGVRTLAFRCTATILDLFSDSVDFSPYFSALWEAVAGSVNDLPSMAAKGNNTPSVLSLLLVLSAHPVFRPILQSNDVIVTNVIMCIGPATEGKALDSSLDFIINLLPKRDSSQNTYMGGEDLISGQILLILRQFRNRFGGLLDDASTGQAIRSIKNVSKELMFLRRIGDLLLAGSGQIVGTENEDVSQVELFNTLSTLLVRFMSHPRSHEADHLNALGIIGALLPKVDSTTALSHFFHLSKLLSHDHWSRLSSSTRREITLTMMKISECNGTESSIGRVSGILQDIFAMHPKRIEEMDYDRVLPALGALAGSDDENCWTSLLKRNESQNESQNRESETSAPKLLTPLVYACFCLLHQDDLVVSRSSFNALRALVRSSSVDERSAWPKFIETTVVPGARGALRGSTEQIRRHAISLIAEVSRQFADSSSPNLHGDLHVLACDENQDLDFFLNILHVQSHRRSRALQRLRARLNEPENDGTQISVHSLANVILPLVTNPIYESKSNLEEGLTQESIATVGALGRHLTWSKYHDVLWTALNQFNRRPEQEKLIIGMICSLLDSFHFELINPAASGGRESAVWRALEKRILPKIEELLVKEQRHRIKGTTKSIRPNVVLALLKLIKKFPQDYFEAKLPRLLAIVCDSLKNRDSNVRELARKALAAMAVEMGTAHLSDILQSLAVTLKEGYQLYVRNATLHHILIHLSKDYHPSILNSANLPDFDRCIPGMMDLILQDMFGASNERKDDADGAKRLVKEAMGSKYADSVEIICRMLLFRPACNVHPNESDDRGLSSVHAVVSPFFEKLREDTVDSKSISKVKECLRRVVIGLSRNESSSSEELLKLVYATIAPIVKVSGSAGSSDRDNPKGKTATLTHGVVVWQPTQFSSAKNAREAVAKKFSDTAKLTAVKDGAQAPKMTGTGRHTLGKHTNDQLNSPRSTCAVEFGLNLLLATLKSSKSRLEGSDLELRLAPFLELLTICVCESRDNIVASLSIRCIGLILKKGVEPVPDVVNPLGIKIIDMLSTGEAVISVNQELTQVCMVALTTLMKLQMPRKGSISREGKQHDMLVLSDDQLDVLVSLLKESVATSDETNASLALIKALLSRKFVSPELYDLMERLLDLSVRSHRESFREHCCNIFLQFLLDYPLSTKRFEQHLRQVMLNLKYEHKEGRISGIRLVASLIERMPLELLDEQAQLIFLPLLLQLVNDESDDCRAAVSKSLTRLVARVSGTIASALYEYNVRWYKGDNATLQRASLQLFGIFAEGRGGMFSQDENAKSIIKCLQSSLESSDSDWEQHYFSLVSLEKVVQHTAVKIEDHSEISSAITMELSHPHLWVKMTASRIVGRQLEAMDPTNLGMHPKSCFISTKGSLYDLATNFCGHLDADESNMSTELSELAIKALTWLARAMESSPDLCYATGEGEGKQPVKWLVTRLSNISRRKGTLRRQAVFKCFAALLHACGAEILTPYLQLMMEPLHRAIIEAAGTKDHLGYAKYSSESDLAKEVLGMLEDACGDEFLTTLAAVKVEARERHDKRRDQIKAEMVADPRAAAKKKIFKQTQEKNRRKRRVEDHRNDRGGKAKRHY